MNITELLKQDLTKYQSIPFWSWNDKLEPEELRRQIRAMKAAGIGGFFMHARGGLTTPYLGDEWFEATAACIDEAKKQGMDAWCYDENGWPSGFAGMKLLEDEANLAHYIVCETKADFDADALAVYVLDGAKLVRVKTPLEGAAQYITVYDKINASVVDILNKQVVRKFLDETHEKYYARFGADFGNPMMGFFTDEPQYFRWNTAYTPVMLAKYQARYGADLLDELGALFVDCEQSSRLRFRYWKLMNSLYIESFAKQIYDWCSEHNCQLTGHSIIEEHLFGQMECCAGVMPFYEYEHIPGIDWLGRDIGTEACPRQVSSAAQQLGRKHVLTETFACAGWDVSPNDLKRIAEWQYVNGVNQMCQHLYPYSIRGQRKRDYPAFYSEHNTWTKAEDFKAFNDYFTALGYMLAESREEADVAVIHPIHSAYLTFQRHDVQTCAALNARFEELIEQLGRANIGHHYVDETLLERHGRVDGNALIMGKCVYHTVVVPEMDGLDANTAVLLKEYAANGGRLYLQGKAPHLIDGEEADLSFLQSNVSFEDMVSEFYAIDQTDTEVRSTFRHSEFGNFLFAVNLSQTKTHQVKYTFSAKGAKLFDLMERSFKPLHFIRTDEGIIVPYTFDPGHSVVIMLDDEAHPIAPAKEKNWNALPLSAEIVAQDENTLPLDCAAVSFDGENYTEPLPIMAVSDMLLRGKTNRTVWLKYTFTLAGQPGSLRVECEKMGARRVWLNGQEIVLHGPGSLDRAFVTADIASLVRMGQNELVYEIDYYQSQEVYDVFNGMYYEHNGGTESLLNCLSYLTDVEAVYLRGNFSVRADGMVPTAKNTLLVSSGIAIDAPVRHIDASRITETGHPFFGGKMTLRLSFEATGDETSLRLDGHFLLAKVSVNGSPARRLMFDHICDVAGQVKPGINTVDVTLYSSYRNIFGPFHFKYDPEPYGVSPDLFAQYGQWNENGTGDHYSESYAVVRFGLNRFSLA